MAIKNQKITLHYSADNVDEPMVYTLIKDYNIMTNITKANINLDKEGYLVMEISGEEEDLNKGVEYLKSKCLKVSPFDERVTLDRESCTQCGACTGVCPSGALILKRPQMSLEFYPDKCVVCNMCITACPVKAVSLDF